MLTFNFKYFILFLSLVWVEVIIAVFLHDAIIRPFFGDLLAVIVLYCLLKSFVKINNFIIAFISLMVAYCLEILQYFDFLAYLGLKHHKIMAIMLGSYFDWKDIFSYTLGILVVLFLEKKWEFGLTERPTRNA